MSVYELAFPDPTRPARLAILCAALDIKPTAFDRLRDGWVELVDDQVQLALYARIGGPNRRDHQDAISALQTHPHYLSDRDDSWDRTYATFRFRLPPHHAEELLADVLHHSAHPGEVDSDKRWQDAIARIKRGDVTPDELAGFERVITELQNALHGDGTIDGGAGPRIIRI